MMFLIKIMKNEKSSLLQECRPCFKQDYRTLMYFLPRILIHSIIECTNEERTLIHNEFMAVLTAPSGFRGLKSKSFDHRYMKSPQYVVTDITKESDTVNQVSVIIIFAYKLLQSKYIISAQSCYCYFCVTGLFGSVVTRI